jgi:CHASE1-domain containing sensor protein/two-component sensor histidine kinase
LKRASLSAAAPWITFVVGIAIVAVVLQALNAAADRSDALRLEQAADSLYARIETQVQAQLSLLRATHAFVETATTTPPLDAFRAYVERLHLRERYRGMQGLGFIDRVPQKAVPATEKEFVALYESSDFHIWPRHEAEGDYFAVVYIEPLDIRNRAVLGFDMLSEPIRKEAMARAAASAEQAMSGIVTLKQEMDPKRGQPGFLVFQAVRRPDASGAPTVAGFVYAPFRAGDFFSAALGPVGTAAVSMEVFEGPPVNGKVLFRAGDETGFSAHTHVDKVLAVGGRLWTFRFRPQAEFRRESSAVYLPYLGLLGLLLSGALAYLSWQQRDGQRSAEREAELLRATSEEKDLLLREMKHRIKNVIARIQAIARQTTRNAGSLGDFQSSFDARLGAMAKTYDLLTESQWTGALLEEVLKSELVSIVGRTDVNYQASGQSVMLAAREVLALGLVFHELTTNALKYGALSHDSGALKIAWDVAETSTGRRLRLEWQEDFAEPVDIPEKTGFGSRLIDMAIMRELEGRVERDFGPRRLRVVIELPLAPQATATAIPRNTASSEF